MSDNKRIAKNTAFLYIRMLFVMGVTLFTSRIILEALGVDDYGIFNVVGGVVAMLGFFNSSMSTSTQRFLNFEMGRGTLESLKRVFSVSLSIHIAIAIITAILLETVGLWFICNKLNVSASGLNAALWVYHCAVITFVLSIIITPYHAVIISNEQMSAYAIISVIEVSLKLAVAFLINLANDKLQTYAILLLGVSIIIDAAYCIYSFVHFPECRCRLVKDIKLAKEMLAFSGWVIFGCITNLFSTQGVNILINIFFGPAYNAARAIAVQIQAAVNQFVLNFMTAVRPPIVKAYSKGDIEYMNNLVYTSSKFSFALLFVIGLPVILNANFIIGLWLVDIPPLAVLFTQLVIIDLLITALYSPIAYVNQASGKIKNYQLAISLLFVLIFGITWLLYRLGAPVYMAFVVSIAISFFGLFIRVWILKKENDFPANYYLTKVLAPISLCGLVSFALPLYLHHIIDNLWVSLVATSLSGLAIFSTLTWVFCLSRNEKGFIQDKLSMILNKISSNRIKA
ncbi:MAG: lipopolysaccharide biosynthesis protein [Bacteroidales bacterium]|nr:lipopolysaccharide biosynthesis protein [Bacteroidales bacterium]